jgi:hypothetical protein
MPGQSILLDVVVLIIFGEEADNEAYQYATFSLLLPPSAAYS